MSPDHQALLDILPRPLPIHGGPTHHHSSRSPPFVVVAGEGLPVGVILVYGDDHEKKTGWWVICRCLPLRNYRWLQTDCYWVRNR